MKKYFKCIHHESQLCNVQSVWDKLFEVDRVYQAVVDDRHRDGTIRLIHPEQTKDLNEIMAYWVNGDCFEQVSEEEYIKSLQEAESFLTKLTNKLNKLITKMKNLFAIVALMGVMVLAQSCGSSTKPQDQTPVVDSLAVMEAPAAEAAPSLDSVATDSVQ